MSLQSSTSMGITSKYFPALPVARSKYLATCAPGENTAGQPLDDDSHKLLAALGVPPDGPRHLLNSLLRYVTVKSRLVCVKPILIQESLRDDPWKVLVATTLLNVTSGRAAIPVLNTILRLFPSPSELAEAPLPTLIELLRPLGLSNIRAARLKDLSCLYLSDPPVAGLLRTSRVPRSPLGIYPPTPVSHLPGCGRYALDSYRIFCTSGDAWMHVMPLDKELKRYMQWRYAFELEKEWRPGLGVVCDASLDYYGRLIDDLAASSHKNTITSSTVSYSNI